MSSPLLAPTVEPATTALTAQLARHYSPRAIETNLGTAAAGVSAANWDNALLRPARDFLARSGKGFRARLVEVAYVLGGGRGSAPELLPQMLELIHAGSLVVDDIEDNSDERRGLPTLHRIYGMPLALNVGNWMYFWPLTLAPGLALPPEAELSLYRQINTALWRCHHGQALDLSLKIGDLTAKEIPAAVEATSRLKTGSLTELAAAAGATVAGAPSERVAALAKFGNELGLGLQMLDDLGNLYGRKEPGKRFEDLRLGRPTWVWAWLAGSLDPFTFSQLHARGRIISQSASSHHDSTINIAATVLGEALMTFLGDTGIRAAHAVLARAVDELETSTGPHPAIELLRTEIARLESSYV